MRFVAHPYALLGALVLLGIVLGVSCWPRVNPATVTPTPPIVVTLVIVPPPAPTNTPFVFASPDVFLVPPTPVPQEVILERTPLATSTVTPTTTPTPTPPPPTETPVVPMRQRG